MGLMGALVKQHLASAEGLAPHEVYHVSVMPCFDKKLEASRPGLAASSPEQTEPTPDVDCVLTTSELHEMLDRAPAAAEASAAIPAAVNWYTAATDDGQLQANVRGDTGSGGYLECVFRYAARELFGVLIDPEEPLPYKAQVCCPWAPMLAPPHICYFAAQC